MNQENYRRAVWGLDPKDVEEHVASLIGERNEALDKAASAEAAYTELRLQSAKQVEEASAEAAVVLGHSRNEATRIREAAVSEADRMRRDGEVTAQRLVTEAEAEIAARIADLEERELQAKKTIDASQTRADEILRFANAQAEKLRSDAYEILRSAEARSQAADNDIRLKRLDAERSESELIDQADQYSKRVHQEADRHWQTTQRRSEELRVQAEDLLREAQARAAEISKDAVDSSRRLMEETMDQLTRIGSEVGGSMSVISRVRRSLGDQLDRLELAEARIQSSSPVTAEPMRVSLEPRSSERARSGADERPNRETPTKNSGGDATENQDEAPESDR